jgi:hypothetical protein
MVGGPPSAKPEAVPGRVTATRVATAGSLPYACSATVGADGKFSLVLGPGSYRFVGRSPKFNGGRVDCAADGDVVIPESSGIGAATNGQNVVVSVDCQRG